MNTTIFSSRPISVAATFLAMTCSLPRPSANAGDSAKATSAKVAVNLKDNHIEWDGVGAFPYRTLWAQRGPASDNVFELVASQKNPDGSTTEEAVTRVTGPNNKPYQPATSAVAFYRAVITDSATKEVVWSVEFNEAKDGELVSMRVTVPKEFMTSTFELNAQYRVNAESKWQFGCATFEGPGNNGYGDATAFAILPEPKKLGAPIRIEKE